MLTDNILCQEIISISSLNSLPFPCRRLQKDSSHITLGAPIKQNKQNDIDRLNKISCSEVDYTLVETGLHRLPVNFNCSASEYNKLLITNGRSKYCAIKVKVNPLSVQNVECLNVPIYMKNQQERIKVIKHQKEHKTIKKQKIPDNKKCVCCCCDDYCQQCDEEMKVNKLIKGTSCTVIPQFSLKKIDGTPPRKTHKSSDRHQTEVEKTVNRSEMRRQQRISKEKQKIQYNAAKQQTFEENIQRQLKLKCIMEESLAVYKRQQNDRKRKQSLENAKIFEARQKVFRLGELIKERNRRLSQHEFKQKYPWGIDQKHIQQINSRIRPYPRNLLTPERNLELAPIPKKPKTFKTQQIAEETNIKCHPVANIPVSHMQIMRMIHFKEAMKELRKFKLQENDKRYKTKQHLLDLQEETQKIIERNPKRKFEPTKQFEVIIQQTNKKQKGTKGTCSPSTFDSRSKQNRNK